MKKRTDAVIEAAIAVADAFEAWVAAAAGDSMRDRLAASSALTLKSQAYAKAKEEAHS